MKKKTYKILIVIIFLAGLSLLLYPVVSNAWNARHQSRSIAVYTKQVEEMSPSARQQLLDAAQSHNRALSGQPFTQTPAQAASYAGLLNPSGLGIMGYVDIPSLAVRLPIYHGTDDAVLQIGVGHVPWSSLPVGGETTHCVLLGHRGLPSAKLFSDLDRLSLGDTFRLCVLNEMYTYQVDQILTVLPSDTAALSIEPGKEYCTLVTCTPYGINTHRLLVRGHRIQPPEDASVAAAQSAAFEPLLFLPLIALPPLVVCLVVLLLKRRNKTLGGNRQ